MANMTFSLPDETYGIVKAHPEFKWSEVARIAIVKKSMELGSTISGVTYSNLLDESTRRDIKTTSKKEWVDYSKKIRTEGKERSKYLTRQKRM